MSLDTFSKCFLLVFFTQYLPMFLYCLDLYLTNKKYLYLYSSTLCMYLTPVRTQLDVSLLQYQNGLNGGKCGVCGDPWGKPNPQFVAGGKYANGIITRTYKEGQVRKRNYILFIWKHILLRILMGNIVACFVQAMCVQRIHARNYFIAYS